MSVLVVAIHDVAPSTIPEAVAWREIAFDRAPGPVSLLLVPRYRGRDSWRSGPAARWARERAGAGDEVVLHGYAHARHDGRDGAELAGRPAREVIARVVEGAQELRRLGLSPSGFIAPAYAHPPAADVGCRRAGLRWCATRLVLRRPGAWRWLPSVGLGASTRARRALSPLAARAAARALSSTPAVRLDLHPADLRHPRLARAGRDLLALLVDQGRRPVTHAALWPPGLHDGPAGESLRPSPAMEE